MEPENAKGSSENVNKNSDETESLDLPSPYGSEIEYEISDSGCIHKSYAQPSREAQAHLPSGLKPIPPPAGTTVPQPEMEDASSSSSSQSSPMKSPPVQTMEHPPGYDPNRIPSSVFGNPANASEWSTTSNESLFSIQMGNNSFSHDYMLLFGKSGELSRSEDWNCFQSNRFSMHGDFPRLEEWSNPQSKSNELNNSPGSAPAAVMEVPSPEQSRFLLSEGSRSEKRDDNKRLAVTPEIRVENHMKGKSVPALVGDPPATSPKNSDVKNTPPSETTSPTPPTPTTPTTFPSPPRFSNASGNSGSSFAFPVLVNNGSKSNAGSLKVVQEKPEEPQTQPPPKSWSQSQSHSSPKPQAESQLQKQDPKGALNAVTRPRWCSCFPCWSRCC